jgi:hypothetical protein
MQHDLNKYKLEILSFPALATGVQYSSSVIVDSASMGVFLDISQLTGATSINITGEGSNDNIAFEDIKTVGATDIIFADLDTDIKKRVFSVSSAGLYKYFRLQLNIVGSPTGTINAISYQIPQDGININNNKR